MESYHGPAAQINKIAYEVFIEKNKGQKEYELSGGSIELALRIHTELSDWIVNHILTVDRQLHPCIHNSPKSKKP